MISQVFPHIELLDVKFLFLAQKDCMVVMAKFVFRRALHVSIFLYDKRFDTVLREKVLTAGKDLKSEAK